MPEPFGWEIIDLASVPPLPAGEIHIFATSLEPDPDWTRTALLTMRPAEKERAARFRFDDDRFCFQKTRTALRLLLSRYLSTPAIDLLFREGPYGKPYIEVPSSDLQFNVSHTRGAAVLAFARGIEIGIDVEHARRKVDIDGVGSKVFTPGERASIEALGSASGLRQFYRLWTAKEAYLKATGSGLSCPPSGIEADFESGCYTSAAEPGESLPYTLQELDTENNFLICLAHQRAAPLTLRACELV